MEPDILVSPAPAAPTLGGGALKSLGIEGMDLGKMWNEAAASKKSAMDTISRTQTEKNTALAPVEQKISAHPEKAPAQPRYDAVPDKMEHLGLDPKQLDEATQTMFMFAAIGGAMTRQPMTAALNAFSSGIQGLIKGDQALFQREAQTFDRNVRQAIAKNQQAAQEYTAAWEKHKMDATALQNEWNLIARKYNDTVASANIQAKDAGDVMKHVENLMKGGRDMERTRLTIEAGNNRLLAQQAGADRRLNATLASRESEGAAVRALREQIEKDKLGARASGRPLPAKAAEDITGRETVIEMIDGLIAKQEAAILEGRGFGGYGIDSAGDLVMKAKRATGAGDQDEVNFFSDLETVAQPDRHSLFGATLTGNEKNSYREGWVGKGDNPQVLLDVLKSKRAQYQQMLDAKQAGYGRRGFNVGSPAAAPGGAPAAAPGAIPPPPPGFVPVP